MSAQNPAAEMPFFQHLTELRTRLIRSIGSMFLSSLICFIWVRELYAWLLQPLITALENSPNSGGDTSVIFLNPVEPFLVYVKVSILGGVFLGSPFILYQLWKFIAPGLYDRERKAVLPFVTFGSIFFIGGALFCRYAVLPLGLESMMGFAEAEGFTAKPQITMQDYFSLSTKMMLAFGAVFEMPVVVLFLSWVRIINHHTLIRYWRHSFVLAFVVGALLTPPDVATQVLLAGPMLVLYLISIGVAYVFGDRGREALPTEEEVPEE